MALLLTCVHAPDGLRTLLTRQYKSNLHALSVRRAATFDHFGDKQER